MTTQLKLRPDPTPEPARGLTIDEFLAFTDTRPDNEKWELIEGEPVLSPSPTPWHQIIALNIGSALNAADLTMGATWVASLGVGVRVPASPNSLPEPDVMVFEAPPADGTQRGIDDALVIVEVISPSNKRQRMEWKKAAYASIANCQHYITVSQKRVEIVCHSRANNWQPERIKGLDAMLVLPALGASVSIPLAAIYRKTPLGTSP